MPQSGNWQPTTFLRFEEARDTSMGPARIVTDAGACYIKGLGNRQGPHPLACEWVGTQLADWFGLPTFDFALMQIDATVDEIPFLRGGKAASGTAFVTCAASGHPWGGSPEELDSLVNPEAVSRLVVFDTWTLNCDRHPADPNTRRPNYDNVFLENVGGSGPQNVRLVAMDHSACFTCNRDLGENTAHIDRVKDERLYGLFPAFVPRIRLEYVDAAIVRLRELTVETARQAVESIPGDWAVGPAARGNLIELICRRACFVTDSIVQTIAQKCWPGKLYDSD